MYLLRHSLHSRAASQPNRRVGGRGGKNACSKKGVKELIVVAQDTTRYGEDIYGECRLSQLLTELCKIDGIHWIRLLYAYPDRLTDDIIDVMAREPKIVKYIDLPIQHCCGEVLSRMNRPGDRESLEKTIEKLRKKSPA